LSFAIELPQIGQTKKLEKNKLESFAKKVGLKKRRRVKAQGYDLMAE
jgi:hypothetical protein